jgi:hypothetical protein
MKNRLTVLLVSMILSLCLSSVSNARWDLGECLEDAFNEEDECYTKDKWLRILEKEAKKGSSPPRYLAYNIWITRRERDQKCINYKVGRILPAGTEIKAAAAFDKAIVFWAKNMDDMTTVNFTKNWHPGKTPNDYLNMMITEKPFSELTAGMNTIEIQAIKEGQIYEGMSKEAALITYGYPPEHQTNSLDEDEWLYWKNKLRRHRICFDGNNRTIPCNVRIKKAKDAVVTGKPL